LLTNIQVIANQANKGRLTILAFFNCSSFSSSSAALLKQANKH
jgi:hypothetical protein